MKKIIVFIAAVMFALATLVADAGAQLYPDTLRVPVTFYDFHADQSNPDFEPLPHNWPPVRDDTTNGNILGMVANGLDVDSKPLPGPNVYFNKNIRYWFRSWGDSAQGDRMRPVYDGNGYLTSTINAGHDTSYKNITIIDTLPFVLIDPATGTYKYDDDEFFPLDGKGFGAEPTSYDNGWHYDNPGHNFSFAMEIHRKFEYKPGLTFLFSGDDDVWVFINGQLAMDIGGIHAEITDTLHLDNLRDLLGLVDGQKYPIDFFYCERHVTESHILITSNVITAEPAELQIVVEPDDTIRAGDTANAFAIVLDQNGDTISNLNGSFSWGIIDPYNPPATLDTLNDTEVRFVPTEAYTTARIWGTYIDGAITITDTATIVVRPGPASHVVIESSPDSTVSLRDDNPRASVTIGSNQITDNQLYAILRDRFGNWVSPAASAAYSSDATSVVTADKGPSLPLGQGTVTRAGSGTTVVTARSSQGFTDAIPVTVNAYTFTALRMVVQNGAVRNVIDSLVITVDDSTRILSEGRNSATGNWEAVDVAWSKTVVQTLGAPPTAANNWLVHPAAAGAGTITITYAAGAATLTKTIPAKFLAGAPESLVLYQQNATPGGTNLPVSSDSISLAAGTAYNLYAFIFDRVPEWLSTFRSDPLKSALITWNVRNSLGAVPAATLDTLRGFANTFRPTQAWLGYMVWATFNDGMGRIFSDTAYFKVTPSTAAALFIEPYYDRNASPRAPNPVDTLRISSNDTIRTTYAILRDQFGNFIRPSNPTSWKSLATTIVTVSPGPVPSNGEGRVQRAGVSGKTMVVAWARNDTTLRDSVPVVLNAYTYNSLRIVIQSGGTQLDISSLTMRTDQDTSLLALGRRSDNGQWEPATVDWTLSGGLTAMPAPPTAAPNWRFSPSDTGSAQIRIVRDTAQDAISVHFLPGLPVAMDIYNKRGNPTTLGLSPYPAPPATVHAVAGTAVPLVAKLFDSSNPRFWLGRYQSDATLKSRFSWSVGTAGTGTFSDTTGDSVSFVPSRAHTALTITLRYTNGSDTTLTDQVVLAVSPGPAAQLVIEGSPDPAASPNAPAPKEEIHLTSIDTTRNAYAILRDEYGNFIAPSALTLWSSLDTATVKVRNGFQINGEGIIRRNGVSGTTTVQAEDSSTGIVLSDNVPVILDAYTIKALRIVVQAGASQLDISSLTMRTDQDTTLLVLGRRSDNKNWEPVKATWTVTPTNLTPAAPTSAQSWNLSPSRAGTGTIGVSLAGATSDQITVTFLDGLPDTLAIYSQTGDPVSLGLTPYPSTTVDVTAGAALDLVAKLFDSAIPPVWLSRYETIDSLSRRITWSADIDGAGTFSTARGHAVTYTPTRAYTTVTVTATYSNGSDTTLTDQVRFRVNPGAPAGLFIEASPENTSPTAPAPLGTFTLNSRDTAQTVYAVVRDTYGNYIGPSNPTDWFSDDTTVVKVSSAFAVNGEGLVRRNGLEGVTTITAFDKTDSLTAEHSVSLVAYTYDALRIVVQAGIDQADISTLVMRTDQDTTLLALGLRSDNGQWKPVDVHWSIAGVPAAPGAPASANSWSFAPQDTGRGSITISRRGKTDAVTVTFAPGLPSQLDIYAAKGSPSARNLTPYPDPSVAISTPAGTAVPLVAKVFDHRGVWLATYETSTTAGSAVRWTSSVAAAGSFNKTRGTSAAYTPVRAYTTVELTATFSNGTQEFSDRIRLAINPGDAYQLVIEANPAQNFSPNQPRPLGTLTLDSRDTSRAAYAVLRDQNGNYIAPSNPTAWSSNKRKVVTVAHGFVVNGEGIIRRSGVSGNATITAQDDSTGLNGTLAVVLRAYTIDSLLIVSGSSNTPIEDLVMRTDQDTTIRVIGLRSDNGDWIPVNADWFSSGVVIEPTAPGSDSAWTFSPVTPGSGIIVVSNTRASDTITVTFNPGLPDHLVLYSREGTPTDADRYGSSRTTVSAGDTVDLDAKIFDRFNFWLEGYETDKHLSRRITWVVEEGLNASDSTGKLLGSGHFVQYLPEVAFRNIDIIASFTPKGTQVTFSDTLRILTEAGAAHHVSIEAAANAGELSPNRDNNVDTLQINAVDSLQTAYLILRDRYGNYVRNSGNASWNSLAQDIVRTESGSRATGEGRMLRVDKGIAEVTGSDNVEPTLNLKSDTVVVSVVDYYYTELRIVDGSGKPVSDLEITTNDEVTLRVQGLRSDKDAGSAKAWEFISARWAISDSLFVDPAPSVTDQWTFSPTSPGEGWVRAYLDNDITQPDTIDAVFAVGPPVDASIIMLTPSDSLVAGMPVRAVVSISNRDGLVPGRWCYNADSSAIYFDMQGDGGKKPPVVIVDGSTDTLNTNGGDEYLSEQCFTDGLDTISFILYHVPVTGNTTHQLGVVLDAITAMTPPFAIAPAKLARVAIADYTMTPLRNDMTITLHSPDEGVTLFSLGYDKYGNERGLEPVDWSIDGTLHAPSTSLGTSRFYYETSRVLDLEKGSIHADASRSIGDSVYAKLLGQPISLDIAYSRDVNGNGLLDQIELHFTRPFDLPDPAALDTMLNEALKVEYDGSGISHTFIIDSIAGVDSTFDSVFVLYLREEQTEMAQTSWTPDVFIDGLEEVRSYPTGLEVIDGAGPVVWRVFKRVKSADDRTRDEITVVFSEPIIGKDGTLDLSLAPENLLHVFEYDQAGETWVPVDNILKGISELDMVSGDTAIVFSMTNGGDLLSRYWINVDSTAGLVTDKARYNSPVLDNQRVRVFSTGGVGLMESGPNPALPDFRYVAAGVFEASHDPQARRYIRGGGRGTIISFELTIPDAYLASRNRNKSIKCNVRVYDLAGNLVQDSYNPDILESLYDAYGSTFGDQSVLDVDLYWNGSNAQGMAVAPGIYKVIVYVIYSDRDADNVRFVTTVGIGH